MSAKSVFRLSTQTPKFKEQYRNSTFPQQQAIMNHDDSVFMGLDAPIVRNSPHFLWQSLTPELRAEALRRAQLIHLLRQVNPNLQLCRKSTSQIQTCTADKGIQVPDIRYELANNRRLSVRPNEVKRSASFTAPGVRIQPRLQQLPLTPVQRAPLANLQPRFNVLKANTSLNIPKESQQRPTFQPKETLQVTLKPVPKPPSAKITELPKEEKSEIKKEKTQEKAEQTVPKKVENVNTENEEKNVVVVEDEKDKADAQKAERQVVMKTKDASSGDEEDSVVVVLNQPRSEQGLERKYGQFFCRRCLRGWSSRSVWCVRHTCKVYIKQTCNICNKLVNPYLVCRLPPITTTRKDRK